MPFCKGPYFDLLQRNDKQNRYKIIGSFRVWMCVCQFYRVAIVSGVLVTKWLRCTSNICCNCPMPNEHRKVPKTKYLKKKEQLKLYSNQNLSNLKIRLFVPLSIFLSGGALWLALGQLWKPAQSQSLNWPYTGTSPLELAWRDLFPVGTGHSADIVFTINLNNIRTLNKYLTHTFDTIPNPTFCQPT